MCPWLASGCWGGEPALLSALTLQSPAQRSCGSWKGEYELSICGLVFPPGCLVPPRQLQPGLSFPITSGSLCFDPSHHPFHVGLPNDFFPFPLPARTHTVLCSRPPPHALPSLSAQAQQWGPAARGPAPQGEVPGDLCDPCQRMLGLPTAPSPKGPRCLLAATPPGPGRSATLAVHQATAGDAHPHFVFWGAVTYKLRKGG